MKRFKNILCVAEHGEDAQPALERAVSLAENNQARLTVVDVIERVAAGIGMSADGPISADLQAAMLSAHSKTLERLVEPFRARVETHYPGISRGQLPGNYSRGAAQRARPGDQGSRRPRLARPLFRQ